MGAHFGRHDCPASLGRGHDGWGEAIADIYHDEQSDLWMAGNGEYGTEISFCPFCGERLLTAKERAQLSEVQTKSMELKP